ncbi:hypothetical protein BgiMline_026726 [Biomphalaria glabrata]|nr:hypothetical protein BgiMline_021180 [Biomphalaria glabrata]
MEACSKRNHCLPLVLSVSALVTVTACALIKTYSPTTNDPILIYLQAENLPDEFYGCLKEGEFYWCQLYLVKKNNTIYLAYLFISEIVVNNYDKRAYTCKFLVLVGPLGPRYQFVCEQDNTKSKNDFQCDVPLFEIHWTRYDDYLEDVNLNNCSLNSNLSYSYAKRTTGPTSTVAPNTTSSGSSNGWTNTASSHSDQVTVNVTMIPNTTSALDGKTSSSTEIIIATVVVGVFILFGIAMVLYCVRTQKNVPNSCALCVKRSTNDTSTAEVTSIKSVDKTHNSSQTAYSHTYDQYEPNYVTQEINAVLSASSDPTNTEDRQNKNVTLTNVSATPRPAGDNYQNTKAGNASATQIKDYARLGEQMREFQNDYNCLIPTTEDNQENNVSIDQQTIQLKDLNLTEYSLACQSHGDIPIDQQTIQLKDLNLTEYSLVCQSPGDVDDELSTPYTLTQIIQT